MAEKKRRKASTGFGRRLHVSEGFRAFALDQLSQVREVTSRSMFGGIGLYSGDVFFGMLAGDVLYLKCDDEMRRRALRAGARPFQPYPDRSGATTKYYEIPLAVLEDLDELGRWVTGAVAVASRPRASKRARGVED